MVPRLGRALAAGAVGAAFVLAGLPVPGTAGATVVETATSVLTSAATGLLAYGNSNLNAADPSQYDVVVINADQESEIPTIKASNPHVRVLVYKNIADTVTFDTVNGVDNTYLPDGVGYAWTQQHHPDWFLKDTNGNRVEWADYPKHYWMDVGNKGYQDTWADNVISELTAEGADGVMMDDVDADLGGHIGGRTLAKYPSDSSYAAATESFLANVGPKLHDAGLLGIANIAFTWTPDWEPLYKRWLSYVDGRLMEFWVKPGQDSSWSRYGDNDWDYQIQQAVDVLKAGKVFIPLTFGAMSDVATQTYARASFLMVWNGGSSSEMWVPSSQGTNPWSPAWTSTIGKPTAAREQLTNGVWQRTYSRGVVLVNPSRTATRKVTLDSDMVSAAGKVVGAVTLAPMTGVVLGVPQVTPPPTDPPTPVPTPTDAPTPTPSVSPTTSAAPPVVTPPRLRRPRLTLRRTFMHPVHSRPQPGRIHPRPLPGLPRLLPRLLSQISRWLFGPHLFL